MKIIILISILFITVSFPQQNNLSLMNLEYETKHMPSVSEASLVNIQDQPARKNIGLAILYSFLLPGMGELYAGSYESGKYFTIAEGVLWGSYLGIDTYGGWLRNRYQSYAQSTGGINPEGKDDEFFAVIGEYSNIEQYNNAQALDRRYDKMYDESTHYWKWSTEPERRSYRNMWVSSEQAFNSLRFVAGALVVNRIASAINAVRLTAAYNRKQKEEVSWNVSVGTIQFPGYPSSLSVNFHTSF